MVEEFIFWEPNTVIYKIGDKSDFAYLLKEGAVEILSENGTKVGYVNAKEVFGEQSILLNTSRTVTAVAIERSAAVKIPKETLLNEFKESSILIRAILRSTYLRLTNLNTTITQDLKNFFDENHEWSYLNFSLNSFSTSYLNSFIALLTENPRTAIFCLIIFLSASPTSKLL